MPVPREAAARRIKDLLTSLSPLIEEHTRLVCPACTDVCCRQKHGMPKEKDRAYFTALGIENEPPEPSRGPDAPCRFLGPAGCSKPRWQRAWKCTWYFCEPLLQAMNEGPQRKARRISELITAILALRETL